MSLEAGFAFVDADDPEIDFDPEDPPPPTAVIVRVKFAGFKSLRRENLLKAELRLEEEVCLLFFTGMGVIVCG